MSVGAVNKQTGDRIPTAGLPAVDSVLSGTSTNPVQNRVVKEAFDGKQNALTFDDTPTDGSNNPVKSNGIYDSEKDIYAAMGEMGAKNLIPYPYVFHTSVNRGITFTANADGTVSFSGTPDNANPSAVNMITRSMYKLKKGTYTLSGGSGSYGGTSIFFYDYASGTNYTGNYTGLLKNSSNQVYIYTTLDGDKPTSTNLYGYDKTFTIEKDAYVDIAVRSMTNSYAQSVSGVIYPMLRLASDTDNTWQPYAKTNKQLTDDVALLDSGKADTDMVASDFDATASYTAGNYCVYEGKFYKFKANHSGAWSAADVDEIKIAGELSALKSGLTNYEFTDSITTHNQWVNTSITDTSIYAGKVIYGYMTDASLGRTYTFAIPVNHMPELQTPIWVQHDVSDAGNSDSIFVAKQNYTNEFFIFLGANIPDMTLYLFVH